MVWKLVVFLRFLELVLNVLLDASGCSFTLRVNLFGTALFTVSVLGGFFRFVSGVVLRFFGSLSSILLGHVPSFPHPVYYEGSFFPPLLILPRLDRFVGYLGPLLGNQNYKRM